MTTPWPRRRTPCRPEIEALEARIQPDIAPIGPIADPDNEVYGSYSFFNEINQSFLQEDVTSLLARVQTPLQVERLRDDLINFIWKGAGFPTGRPLEVWPDALSPFMQGLPESLPSMLRTELLVIEMDYGFRSYIYALYPKTSTNRLAIWHQGHDYDPLAYGGLETVSFLLERGYTVLTAWMPLLGENTLPEKVYAPSCHVPTWFVTHDDLACLETETFTPMKFFVEPVAVALNYMLAKQPFRDVAMIGLSGGGWTTTLYAALDPRVTVSVPVAGSYPSFLNRGIHDWDAGDWEQSGSALYQIADYLDLHVLGAYGPGRRQLQVLNKYDDCCFSGVRFRVYLDHVKDTLSRLGGGTFDVFLNDSRRLQDGLQTHWVADHALNTAIRNVLDGLEVQFVDDGENTYWNGGGTDRDSHRMVGRWIELLGFGFGRDEHTALPSRGESASVWQFKVTPGEYRIAVTWDPWLLPASQMAPFSVYDGTTLLASILIDQTQQPSGYYDGGAVWQILIQVTVTGTLLEVHLNSQEDGVVIADGVRVVRIPDPVVEIEEEAAPGLSPGAGAVGPKPFTGPSGASPAEHGRAVLAVLLKEAQDRETLQALQQNQKRLEAETGTTSGRRRVPARSSEVKTGEGWLNGPTFS